MIRFVMRSLYPGCGRRLGRPVAHPVAHPLVWCSNPQNSRWSPVAAPIVARTYMSLLNHLLTSSTDGSPARPRPLRDGVRQAGQGRILQVGAIDRVDVPGLEVGVTGVDRPILWLNCLVPTPSCSSILVWKECRNGVVR